MGFKDFFKKKKKNKVCVIGLDGVPYSLLQNLAQQGVMPYTAELLDSGYLHKMKASLPEISAVSWTNFMTGSNPGTHGIFGFTDFKKGSYDLRFPNFLDLQKETFWDTLGKQKKKSIIINQPSTYPARKINGTLISGFVAIDLAKAVFPYPLKDSLQKMNYQIDIDTFKSREDHEFLWKDLEKTLQGREKAFQSLWKEDWDYFEIVVTGTDRLMHFLWNAYEDSQHFYHQNFLDYFRKVDNLMYKVGSSFKKLNGNREGLYILSDHGFTGIKQEVFLNAWLEKENYLQFNTSSPQNLSQLSPKSQAFALDPNRIYVHLKNKFPQGCVDESEKEELKREITDKLNRLEYQGEKVVRRVFDSNEIYKGPFLSHGPDLLVLSHYGFDMKGSVKKKKVFGRSHLQGMHTWDDAFFWSATEKAQDLTISHLSSIILNHFQKSHDS